MAGMTIAAQRTELSFQIGTRKLLRPARKLVRIELDFPSVVGAVIPPLPPLGSEADGYIVRSVPLTAVPAGAKVIHEYRRFAISVSGKTFDRYMKERFDKKARYNLKRMVRQWSETKPDVREYSRPEHVDEFCRIAGGISLLTYQHKLLDAGLPQGQEALAEMLALAAQDRLRGYVLYRDETPAAYAYCVAHGRVLTYTRIGYDQTFAKHSPGDVLLLEILVRLFAGQRFDYFDFGMGEAKYKATYATDYFDCADVLLLNPTIANRLLAASLSSFNRAVRRARDFAARTGGASFLYRRLRKSD